MMTKYRLSRWPLRWILGGGALAGLVAVILIAVMLLPAAKVENKKREVGAAVKKEKADIPAETKRVIDLLVIHKQTKEPMADVALKININKDSWVDKTNEEGRCRIKLGKKELDYVRIEASKKGFVPMQVDFGQYSRDRTDIPKSYTLALEPGTSIGGIIQDEDGKPIEGATVYLLVPGGGEIEQIDIWDHEEKTDTNGRWRCDIMPLKLDDIWIRLAHPDYINDEMYGMTPRPSIEELRAMTGVMVMKKGLAVTGRVVDANGQPIEKASVSQGSDRCGSHYPSTKTDAEGQFKFANTSGGQMVLTVQAKGYAPELKEITVYKGMSPVEFRLEPGHTIRGRIVDPQGKPIKGAFVAADTWRGHRSIEWRVDTDAQGRFEWNDAPADEVLIDMGQVGYMSIRNYGMSASDKEYVITMHRELVVSGKVTDAETGEPIGKFKVLSGIDWGGDQPIYWERRRLTTVTEGRYEIIFDEPQHGHLIRIEADGYAPGISRSFKDDEGEVVFDFELKKGTGPAGTVRFPDGRPAAGAEVILCTPSQYTQIKNGRNEQKRDSQFFETRPDGRFSFPVQTEPYLLVVLHERGYAEVKDEELRTDPSIVIEPWGHVEGELRIGSKAGVNEEMSVWYDRPYEPNAPQVYHDCSAVTDSEGHFVFEHIAPGQACVGREIKLSDRSSGYSHGVPIEIKAGDTISVTIGGTGRPVIGKVTVPSDYKKPINLAYGHNILSLKLPEEPRPENFDEMTIEERQAWYKNWAKSEEGKAFDAKRKQHRSYAVKIEHDGSFRVEDIPAGKYELQINVFEPPVGRQCGFGEPIGGVSREFEVAEMAGGRSDEPLDIGTLELKIIKRLEVGYEAPLFEIKTLEGKDLKLADYRGKIVLLAFWATWCGPCVAETPKLKELYDAFGKDERFVMIGLSLDGKAETAKKYVAENELKWLQGFLGDWSKAAVAEEYGITWNSGRNFDWRGWQAHSKEPEGGAAKICCGRGDWEGA